MADPVMRNRRTIRHRKREVTAVCRLARAFAPRTRILAGAFALLLASALLQPAGRTEAAEARSASRLRDPMQPQNLGGAAPESATAAAAGTEPATEDGHDGGLRLASIRRPSTGAARALINGEWVAAGAVVAGWRVRAIGADSVLLQSTGEPRDTKVLALHQLSIRRLGQTP